MKTALWGSIDTVRRVYSAEALAKIEEIAGEKSEVVENFLPTGAEAVFTTWGMRSFPADELRTVFPDLKYVFYAAGSVRAFAEPYLDAGVRIFSAWKANAVPVAEFTEAQIILCGKRYFDVFTGTKGRVKGNYDLKVGLIGLGAVGRLTAEGLKKHRLKVLAYDKFLDDSGFEKAGVVKAGLEEIFAGCDVISNHLADNPETRGMISRELLSSMKKDAYFINTGRGAQVDHDALYDVMKAEPERTCLLDVTYPEPLPGDHPLRTLKNVIISPHIAGSAGTEVERMGDYMVEEFERVLTGGEPLFEVTREMLGVMA
ncbi:MAG: hydroxyacid dehydrogenase [Clostridia bacterium]|nr:hydroxyacid dehydrogenase [Clostridia bacterium]